jgi:hypothetical protein
MLRIPLQAVPNQTLNVTLDRQAAQIALRQNGDHLYFDLQLGERYITRTRICRDRQRLLLNTDYKGFVGDFIFIDTQRSIQEAQNPFFTGLGDRFALIYLQVGE